MTTITGSKISDSIVGTPDEQNILDGKAGNDSVVGGHLADKIIGGAGLDGVWGLQGDDVLTGGTGNDFISGGRGNDSISGGEGNDLLFGGKGDDLVSGGKGNDVLHGNTGNDDMNGNSGDDALYGLAGNDLLNGGAGNDSVSAGSGDDTVIVSTGNDQLFGGSGHDTLDFRAIAGHLDINLSKGTASFGKEGYVQHINGFETIFGGDGGTHFMGSDKAGTTFVGGAGDDWIRGKGGNDVLTGGDGHDTFAYLKKDTVSNAHDTITDFKVGEDRLDLSDFLKGHQDYSQVVRIVDAGDGAHIQGLVKHEWVNVVTLAGVDAQDVGPDHHQMTLADLGILAA